MIVIVSIRDETIKKLTTRDVLILEKEMVMYDGKVFGVGVSDYGIEHGYLDYEALRGIVGNCILNNNLFGAFDYDTWELVSDEDSMEVFQYYIIDEHGYEVLHRFTDEIVYYNPELDIYLWGITHFGTSWDYVLTDIKLVNRD